MSSTIEEDSHGRDIEKFSLNSSNINASEKISFPSFEVICGKDIKPIIYRKASIDSKVNLHSPQEKEVL